MIRSAEHWCQPIELISNLPYTPQLPVTEYKLFSRKVLAYQYCFFRNDLKEWYYRKEENERLAVPCLSSFPCGQPVLRLVGFSVVPWFELCLSCRLLNVIS